MQIMKAVVAVQKHKKANLNRQLCVDETHSQKAANLSSTGWRGHMSGVFINVNLSVYYNINTIKSKMEMNKDT